MSDPLNSAKYRDKLPPRREPYWGAALEDGRYIGFRKLEGKPGSWIARVRVDDEELRERFELGQKTSQTYKDLGSISKKFDYFAACKAAQQWFAEIDAGVTQKGPFTVAHAAREYVEELRRNGRANSADDAEWRFKRGHVYGMDPDANDDDEQRAKLDRLHIGRIEITRLRAPTLKSWRDLLAMGPSGQNRMMAVLRAALNLSVTNNRVPATAEQAWRAVKQHKKADGRREIFLDLAQRRALLDATKGALHDLLEAALLTGARPGELVTATRAAFDARTKLLKLSGKTGPRDLPLTGPAFTLFERLAKSKLPGALLLTRDDGGAWTKIGWSREVRAAADAAVVKDERGKNHKLPAGVVLYTMRHSAITQWLMDGMTTLDVARLTGTSLMMIQAHYGQFVQGAVRERLEKVQML